MSQNVQTHFENLAANARTQVDDQSGCFGDFNTVIFIPGSSAELIRFCRLPLFYLLLLLLLCWWLCNDRSFLVICLKYQLIIFYHNLPWAGFIPELILFPSNVRVQWQSLNLLCFYHIMEKNGNFVMETSGLLLKTK